MTDYEKYMIDNFKLSPIDRFVFGKRDKETLSHYDIYLADDYINEELKIIEKYKSTNDIELKCLLENNKFSIDNKLYLLLFSCFENFISNYLDDNDNLYPKNNIYKKSRDKDFDKLILCCIEKAKEGLKLKITYPKIIIKKFLDEIKQHKRFLHLYNFIKNHYYPFCRNEIGLCYIKNGKEFYSHLIKENTGFLDITPEKVHKIGLELLKDVKKNSKSNVYKSREEMFNDCLKYADYVYKNILHKYFHFIPKKPFKIEIVSKEFEKNSPLGYYKPLENIVFINLSYFNEISIEEIHSLIMHECLHSYHFEYMKYLKIPKYKYYKYFNTALAEGFAFYMESYCDNYDDNKNNMSIMRKIRLVVDTGINYYGWTYKKSFDFMKLYMPKKISDIKNELERYICIPAQAISYMIGKLHIIKLRDDYLQKGGNIKDFHHLLLVEGLASFKTIDNQFYSSNS
jgi:uncharacterized protein (DUF885 family)